jgi:hypothetical protein
VPFLRDVNLRKGECRQQGHGVGRRSWPDCARGHQARRFGGTYRVRRKHRLNACRTLEIRDAEEEGIIIHHARPLSKSMERRSRQWNRVS